MFWDSSVNLNCNYIQYQVTNDTSIALSNLWVKVDTFVGTRISLGGGDSGLYNLGTLAAYSANSSVYFYFRATNTTTAAETHVVHVYQGYPGANGVELTNKTFSLNVLQPGNNQANKISAVLLNPAQPILGGQFTIEVDGATSTMNGGADLLYFIPAANTNWAAGAFNLINTLSILTNNGTVYNYTNRLLITSPGSANKANNYVSQYTFRALGVTVGSVTNSPDGVFQTGGGYNHSTLNNGVTIPAIPPPTNALVMTNFANLTQLYTNQTVTITNRFYNASSLALQLDRVVSILPAGFLYVSNSTTFGGATIGNPTANGQTNTWSSPVSVPANGSADLVFQTIPTGTNAYVTNYSVAYIGNTLLDQTLNTADYAPATNLLRVLWEPQATNDTASAYENASLTVAAPGVLSNDNEPNGFTMTVVAYTQPAHGTVTVNANGAFTYLPGTNYNGSDSFTYTFTNGNARVATATVNLTVIAVNQAPTLDPLGNLAVNENDGLQTVNLSGITAGPANESSQTLTVTATSSNPALVPNPTVNYTSPDTTGSITFTPVASAFGTSIITVIVQDNGGTANGGINAVTNTFTFTVNTINQPPTLNPIGNASVNENGGQQTVNLSGIAAGPTNESSQTLTIIATSSNPALVPDPTVTYTSPDATGTLTFAPATNVFGTAIITVILLDSGGTANGGINAVTNTFTITVNAVNQSPTLNAITSLMLTEMAAPQTVDLSGITAGPANESSQTLSLTATSSNPALVPDPTVDYTSPSATGSISFTVATNTLGTTTISVILTDDGGTANGGINSITNTFTVTVQALTNAWNSGGQLTVNVNDATATAGTGYTQTNYTGFLDVLATGGSPFTLQLGSLNGGSAGPAANFNNDSNYTWTVATTTRGVLEFDPAKIVVDTSTFANDLAGGTFSVTTNGNTLELLFVPNHAPVAFPLFFSRAWGTTMRIPVAYVLTNFTADPDGDPTVMTGLGASTNSTPITTNSVYVFFTPTNNLSESFSYTIQDARNYRPGDTVRTATNWISVTVTNAVSSALSAVSSGGSVSIHFAGVPGYAYDVEASPDLTTWTVVFTTNAPARGLWTFTDNNPPQPSAFYRLRQH